MKTRCYCCHKNFKDKVAFKKHLEEKPKCKEFAYRMVRGMGVVL